jgi:hypothetical protein
VIETLGADSIMASLVVDIFSEEEVVGAVEVMNWN